MISQILGLFHVIVGLMLVASILLFLAGFFVWIVRLGTQGRDEGIDNMGKGLTVLFVLVVLLALVEFFQQHTQAALYAIAIVLLGVIGYVAIQVIQTPSEDDKDH